MVSLASLQTLITVLAPFLLPRIISYVQRVRHTGRFTGNANGTSPVSLSSTYMSIIFVFFLAAVLHLAHVALFLTRNPQGKFNNNVFQITGLPILTPTETVAAILARLGRYNERTEFVLTKISSPKARAIYAAFGNAITDCSWCSIANESSYRLYVLPTLLWPFFAQIGIVGVSTAICKKLGAIRVSTSVVLVIAMVYVMWRLLNFDPSANINGRGRVVTQWLLDDLLRQRDELLATFDIVLAGITWLVGTNRWVLDDDAQSFVSEHEIIIRDFHELERKLDDVLQKERSANMVRGAVINDDKLRLQCAQFWAEIAREEKKLVENAGVRTALNEAREADNYDKLNDEAGKYAEAIVGVSKLNLAR
ncbi:uncharacterized protein V1513DRAFT_453694 [Lipomyces chichibuensis]|uniref:uncharacterized protein n=1 Tax=Lipomyces chichibuensis TaxID=1546026 RepID=UPI0033435A1F